MNRMLYIALLFVAFSSASCTSRSYESINTVHPSKLKGCEIVRIESYNNKLVKIYYWDMSDTTKHEKFLDTAYVIDAKKNMIK